MTCTECGARLAEGADTCSVCDPWAVPTATGSLRPAVAAGAPAATAAVPRWIMRLAKRNPPAHADLDKAWRNTVIVVSVSALFCGCLGLTLLAEFLQSPPALVNVIGVVTAASFVAFLVCLLVIRRNQWLSRAIAVVGTRPDIGYAGFARLSGITRMTAMNGWIRGAVLGLALLRVAANLDQNLSPGARNSVWALYLLAVVPLSLMQASWQASARRELQQLLARR